MTPSSPASMGGPLSEAEQLRAENAKLLRKLELANKHRQHSIESRHKLERKLISWREAAESAAKERDAYKRAKQENDERFQLAAAEAREERDAATARVGVLEGQLATAQGLVADLIDGGKCSFDHHGYCQEHGWFETEPTCPHGRAKALGLDGGDPDER